VSADLRRRFRLDHWQEPAVRRAWTAHLLGNFEILLSQCDWAEIALTPAIRAAAIDLIAEYNLNTHDAVHLASAREAGVVNLASLDRGYRRVDGLHLWNDRVYG
jgi:predicted nucleic acid-binding protein